MARLGLTIPPPGYALRDACDLARRAEDLGYTDLWTAEVSGVDGLAAATAVGAVTTTARTGCAIVPIYTRPPALIAMGALAAQEASAGRFALGLGASTPTIVSGWMGLEYDKPVARMRETVQAVKAALSGDKVKMEGSTVSVGGFRLDQAAVPAVPVFIAALGPQMLKLAADVADGVALFFTSEEGVRIAAKAVPDLELVARIICVPDEDVTIVRDFVRRMLVPYLTAEGYRRFAAAQGFEEETERIAKLWGEGDREGAVAAVSDRLVEAMVVMGPAGECRERIQSFRDAGLSTPIVLPLSLTGGRDGIEKAITSLAGA
jgi:probable F420-dependent oxidoreductase